MPKGIVNCGLDCSEVGNVSWSETYILKTTNPYEQTYYLRYNTETSYEDWINWEVSYNTPYNWTKFVVNVIADIGLAEIGFNSGGPGGIFIPDVPNINSNAAFDSAQLYGVSWSFEWIIPLI